MKQLKITQSVTARDATLNRYLADIARCSRISPEEEAELASRIRGGDEEAVRTLVESNLRFVVSVAKTYQGHGLALADLINEGNLGLIKAAWKFDPTRGFKFISYAVWWIRQSILQGIADQSRMVRLPLNQIGVLNKISRLRGAFLQDNEREPTDEELSALSNIPEGKIGEALRSSASHLSLDNPFDDESDGTLLDVVPDTTTPETDADLTKESLRSDLAEVMKMLAPREREIVLSAYGIGCKEKSLEEIGDEMSLTRERVRQIKEKAIRKLARPAVRSRLNQYR